MNDSIRREMIKHYKSEIERLEGEMESDADVTEGWYLEPCISGESID